MKREGNLIILSFTNYLRVLERRKFKREIIFEID